MTKYNKRIGDSFVCDWREKFCGKVEQGAFCEGADQGVAPLKYSKRFQVCSKVSCVILTLELFVLQIFFIY